jgi:xylan 1,4-beta-xylosidase
MKKILFLFLLLTSILVHAQPIHILVDANKTIGTMHPFWSYFGYDEPNYTYMPDGKKLLKELQALSYVPVHIRTHNLLTSKGKSAGPDLKWGYTNAYRENASGEPVYNWTIIDSIVDTYIQSGIKPLMEIGFMPEALSVHPDPYEHHWSQGGNIWTGWTYPPKDYKKWSALVQAWVKHSIDRYGKQEVSTWLWEVWNEPDIGYWSGSLVEYLKLYDYAAYGLKQACPECKIGGPHTTSPRNSRAYDYLIQFIDHCLHGMNHVTWDDRLAARLYWLSCKRITGIYRGTYPHEYGSSAKRHR